MTWKRVVLICHLVVTLLTPSVMSGTTTDPGVDSTSDMFTWDSTMSSTMKDATPDPTEQTTVSDGETTEDPGQMETTIAHETGQSTAVPVTGQSTAVPVTGQSTAAPVTGQSTAVPVTGQSTAAPVKGQSTAVPVTGQSTAAPVKGQSTAAPVTEKSTAATDNPFTEGPDDGSTAAPQGQGNSTDYPDSTEAPDVTDGTSNVTTSGTDTVSPRMCYSCTGSYETCGKARTSSDKTDTCAANQDCLYQVTQDSDKVQTYIRSCHTAMCTENNKKPTCTEGTVTTCLQCCSTDKCNSLVFSGVSRSSISGVLLLCLVLITFYR